MNVRYGITSEKMLITLESSIFPWEKALKNPNINDMIFLFKKKHFRILSLIIFQLYSLLNKLFGPINLYKILLVNFEDDFE